MRRLRKTGLGIWLFFPLLGLAQVESAQIKVYDFDEGLSHRNVFKIQQDQDGFIWIATINGLNRFDGYSFIHFNSQNKDGFLPFDALSDMVIDRHNRIWLANSDHVTILEARRNSSRSVKIKEGDIVPRESWTPHNLFIDHDDRLWMATFDERTAVTTVQTIVRDTQCLSRFKAEGQYSKRPIAQLGDHFFVGAYENELWKLDRDGRLLQQYSFAASRGSGRITQIQVVQNRLWILLADGRLFSFTEGTAHFEAHRVNRQLRLKSIASSLLVEPNGNVWIGGQGELWFFNAQNGSLFNYDAPVRQIVKYEVNYRQIFKDQSDVIWIASNFGAIKIVPSDMLFRHYLSGGSEYCNNVLCSVRGITEDEKGKIYFSYYNSIHVLDPDTDRVRPLFPSNDYFNYPFGLLYHQGALWTGNGLRIDLKTLKVDTIFQKPSLDLGVVIADREGMLWFGFQEWLFLYDPVSGRLEEHPHWTPDYGRISYLYQGKTTDDVWVATLSNGLFRINKNKGVIAHYHTHSDGPVRLHHNQVNVVLETDPGFLWLGTAAGLHRIDLIGESIKVYDTRNGLLNAFINGLLPEADSCFWLSTDQGLARFSQTTEQFVHFTERDGLSHNEFNRISFLNASNGRFFFGGLNGVNAFFPGDHFLQHQVHRRQTPILLTNFTQLDGESDSIYSRNFGISKEEEIVLSHADKIFGFSFALADFRHPLENKFSYLLEGYDQEWSLPTAVNTVRYNNIPAGTYTFRVRAMNGPNQWMADELAVKVRIKEAYYRTWWFWTLVIALLLSILYGLLRYRVYQMKQRERALEGLINARTHELKREKQKSEELLLNILPAETAEELKKFGTAKARRHETVTVMFSDIQGFSQIAEQMDPEELVAEIDYCYRAFDQLMDKYGLEKIKTIGDAYMCMCIEDPSSPPGISAVRMVRAALEIQEFFRKTAEEKKRKGALYFESRIGIHTGPVVAGVVGSKKFAYDIWGDTVNIASRMESLGCAGKVNISGATYRLVQPYFNCTFHGNYTARNRSDIAMYFVEA